MSLPNASEERLKITEVKGYPDSNKHYQPRLYKWQRTF